MKLFIAVSALAAIVAAGDFGNSCTGEQLDAATEVLSATCDTGDGKGTTYETSLDLNKCLKYSDGQILFSLDGNFGKSCDNCYAHRVQDPVWPGSQHPTLNCTCEGSKDEASLNLDNTPILNKYGKLQCIY